MYTVQRMFASVLRYERHSKIGSCHDYDAVNRGDASLATTSLPSAVTTVLSTACRADHGAQHGVPRLILQQSIERRDASTVDVS